MLFMGLELCTEGVYEPREDSLLLAEVVREKALGKVLDVGTGSGIQAITASRTSEHVTSVDISEKAVKMAKKNAEANKAKNINFAVSNLFGNVSGLFDVIIFNPPYLPVEGESRQWAGGENGRQVIKRFASGIREHLKPGGLVLMVISSLTGLEETKNIFTDLGLSVKIAKQKKIPWETLYVLEIN